MAWDESAHPRNSKGSAGGGRFKTKGGTTAERRKAIKSKTKGTDKQGRTKAQRGERRRAQVRDIQRNPKSATGKRAAKAIKAGAARFKKRKTTPAIRRTRRRRAGR